VRVAICIHDVPEDIEHVIFVAHILAANEKLHSFDLNTKVSLLGFLLIDKTEPLTV
jgi:DNA-binding XRE family transcriptional regulator